MRKFYHLYRNVGRKIYRVARLIGFIGCIAAIFGFFMFIANTGFIPNCQYAGLVTLISGVSAFILSFPLYAYGLAVHDIHRLKKTICDETEYEEEAEKAEKSEAVQAAEKKK